MQVIEAQCSWSWRLTITLHINHEGESGTHFPLNYASLWQATPSGADWVPADLTEA